MCFSEEERDLFLLYVSIKVTCYHGDIYFFHPVFSKHSLCFKFWVNSRSLCPPFIVLCSMTTSGQAQASLQDQVPHLTEIFMFWCLCQYEPVDRVRKRAFYILRPLIWQVLKFSVPISMPFFPPKKESLPILTLYNSKSNPVSIRVSLHSPGWQSLVAAFLLIL